MTFGPSFQKCSRCPAGRIDGYHEGPGYFLQHATWIGNPGHKVLFNPVRSTQQLLHLGREVAVAAAVDQVVVATKQGKKAVGIEVADVADGEYHAEVVIEAALAFAGMALSAALILSHLQRAGESSVVLLLKWQGWKLLFPGDAEVRSCYRNAKALVFPSLVEGYGLPIVEALHHRLPVLASDMIEDGW